MPNRMSAGHHLPESSSTICIDSPKSRFNFWIYYFKKKIIHELDYYYHRGRRRVKCPFHDLDSREDGFWLLDQCKFIQTYQSAQKWKIDWVEMIENPELAWAKINDFLEHNQKTNYWSLDHWIRALDNYKSTIVNVKINTNHASWKIWAAAALQSQGIGPPGWNLSDNFNNHLFNNWIKIYQDDMVAYTEKTRYFLG